MRMLVVIGPGTRVAREILALPGLSTNRTLLVARDRGEADWLTGYCPDRPIYRSWDEKAELPAAPEGVGLVVASLLPGRTGSACALQRDLWVVARVLRNYEDVPVHITCASHVRSLVSERSAAERTAQAERAAETALTALSEEFALTTLSIVFPGGLVERRSPLRPSSFMRTTYASLAGTLLELSARVRGEGRVLGVDARLRLWRMGVEYGLFAALGRVPTLRMNQRVRLDTSATVSNSGFRRALQSASSVSYDASAVAAGDERPANHPLGEPRDVHSRKSGR